MSQIRLDKFLCHAGLGTRNTVKELIKKSQIKVNNEIVRKGDIKIDMNIDVISHNDKVVKYDKYEYYILNKPAGYVSATNDNVHPTVIDIISTSNKKDLFPVGRLDKDTEGLLIITNDGELSHKLLSPKRHVDKTYFALIDSTISESDIISFKNGLDIGEDNLTLPATLKILEATTPTKEQLLLYNIDDTYTITSIEVTICEGKYHQVKRMFEAIEKHVLYLKRLSMGSLHLDNSLNLGEYRPLTKEELDLLKKD